MAKLQPAWGPGKPVHVLRVDSGAPAIVLFLGPLMGHMEHWVSRGTLPCYGERDVCMNHAKGRLLFYAYAAVLWHDVRTGKPDPWILQATACLEEQLRGRDLRGEVWCLTRDPEAGKNGELSGQFVEKRKPDNLPAEFDIIAPLKRMFQVRKLNIPVANPNPARVVPEVPMVEPLVLTPPKVHVPLVEMSVDDRKKAEERLQKLKEANGWKGRQ
jgi:hypothetical protein